MVKSFKYKIIVTLILTVLSLIVFMPVASLAMDHEYMRSDQFDDSSYNTVAETELPGTNGNTLGKFIVKALGVILAIVRTFAVGWAIFMAISISWKYMVSGPQAKAQLKTDVPTYLIGAVILFGASGLLTLIQYFIEDNVK